MHSIDDVAPFSLAHDLSISRRRQHRQDGQKRRRDGGSLADVEGETERRPRKRKVDLMAEIEDLEIDMEGWGGVDDDDRLGRVRRGRWRGREVGV